MGKLTLITGGASSGKSKFSEELTEKNEQNFEKVTYLATAISFDEEMEERVRKHQERRPSHWGTVEAPNDLINTMIDQVKDRQVILLDSLSMYLSNKLLAEDKLADIYSELNDLKKFIRSGQAHVVIVTDEVGSSLIPESTLGRRFRELIGEVNQMIAEEANEVYLVVSGIPMQIK